jgi:group I intron endonuclease
MKKCGIYKITSPSGKIYVGQSVNIKKRFWNYHSDSFTNSSQRILCNSFLKYGVNNHIFEIIEECFIEELNSKERYWQEYYEVVGPKGLNCLYVSTSEVKCIMSEETRLKKSLSMKGKKPSESTKKKMSLARLGIQGKPVLQYDLEGNFIQEFNSCRTASISVLGHKKYSQQIGSCANLHKLTCHGFIWRFKTINEIPLYIDISLSVYSKKRKFNTKYSNRSILCIEDNKLFKSIKECALYYNVSVNSISNILSGRALRIRNKKSFKLI